MSQVASRIAADRDHGADALARMAIEALQRSPSRKAARLLAMARPGMPVIAHRVAMAWQDILQGHDPLQRLDQERHRLFQAAPTMGPTVTTISRSSTVEALLCQQKPRVLVWRSRPGGEGSRTVQALRRCGVDAHVVDDHATPDGTVLIGADAVLLDGTVWNKVGSQAMASMAPGPVFVAAATAKLTDHDADWLAHHAEPANAFEAVSAAYIDGYITEAGLLTVDDLPAAARPHRQALAKLEEP